MAFATIEPLRDSLIATVVTTSLTRGTTGRAAGQQVERLAGHRAGESVWALLSSLLRNTRQMLSVTVAAVGGLAVLSPVLALVVYAAEARAAREVGADHRCRGRRPCAPSRGHRCCGFRW